MKFLCRFLAGSHAYGLNTPESDLDYRGVYINTTLGQTIGLDRHEVQDIKREKEDEVYFELRHHLNSLRRTNVNAIEFLFNNNLIEFGDIWELIRINKNNLIDPEKFYKSTKGYLQSERRFANGERLGVLGKQRRATIDKYGFSPKNYANAIRITYCAAQFFRTGNYPVDVMKFNSTLGILLKSIKTNSGEFTKAGLTAFLDGFEKDLDAAHENHKLTCKFDVDVANEICLLAYRDIISGFSVKKLLTANHI